MVNKMNIFKYEMKANFKLVLVWSIVTILLVLVILAFYPMIKSDASAIIDMLKNYPESLRNAFGMNIDKITSIDGFYLTMPMSFILICSSLEAMLLGVNIISKEVRDKTADFLFTKPISRGKILLNKLLASITLITLSSMIVYTIIYFMFSMFSDDQINMNVYLLVSLSVILLQIFFICLGFVLASLFKKVKSPTSLTMIVVLGLYAFNSFADDKMRPLIPFRYLNSDYIVKHNSFELGYLLLLIVLSISFIYGTYLIYTKKDINSI